MAMSLIRHFGLLGVIAVFAFPLFAHAAPHPASAEECTRLTTQGVTCITGKTLYDPANQFIGDEVAEATKFLLERNGSGSRDTYCYKSQSDRITRMNPQFRISLYKALTEMEKQYGGKNIIQSGFRCAGSTHGSGCAADIIWTSCSRQYPGNTERAWRCSSDLYDKGTNTWNQPEQKWIDANGKNYGIHLRLRFAPEGHHVEPVNTQGCVTGATVGSGSPSGSPSSDFSNAIRQALGVSQQPQLPPQPALPPQSIASQQSPIGAFQEPVSQVTATSSEPGTATSSPSVADRLAELAGIEPKATTTSATSVPLVIDGSDRGSITSTRGSGGTATTSGIGSGITQNTFTSDDLAFRSEAVGGTQGAFAQTLALIRATLVRLLQYLRPFGGTQHYLEMEDEY